MARLRRRGRPFRGAPTWWFLVAFSLSCARREPVITYFDAAHEITFQHPVGWKTKPAEASARDGAYRRFRPSDAEVGLTASLIAGGLEARTLEEFAASFSAGKPAPSKREIRRGTLVGLALAGTDAEGRYELVLLPHRREAVGLLVRSDPARAKSSAGIVEALLDSFQVESAADYRERGEAGFGLGLRLPPSWRETQGFAKGKTLLRVFASPPVGVGDNGAVVHATLTVTVEPLGAGGFAEYYRRKNESLGEAFPVVKHEPWKDGFADTIVTETAVVTSRIKRFYRGSGSRGYCLAFEASDDVYRRVAPWFDFIADTLEISTS